MKSWDTEPSAEDMIGTKNLHVFKDRRLSMNRYLLQIIKYITSTSALRVLSLSGQKPGYFWKKIRHAHLVLTLFQSSSAGFPLGSMYQPHGLTSTAVPTDPNLATDCPNPEQRLPQTQFPQKMLSVCSHFINRTLHILPVVTSLKRWLIFM